MHPRNVPVPAIAGLVLILALILAAAGCASAPSPPPADAPPSDEAGSTAGVTPDAAAGGANAAIRFHVDGPATDEGSCALRFFALHGSDLAPVDVELEIEIFRASDDVVLGSMASTYELPMMTTVETVDGMESPITGDNLTLPCDDLRAEIQVVSCDPSPCPSLGVQPGFNLVPLTITGPNAG